MSFEIFTASARSFTFPSLPGITGTPALIIAFLASILSPIFWMTSELGPIKCNPLFLQMAAKFEFSDKKPYPGCTPSQPAVTATLAIQ